MNKKITNAALPKITSSLKNGRDNLEIENYIRLVEEDGAKVFKSSEIL